jgi:hypothetical protein
MRLAIPLTVACLLALTACGADEGGDGGSPGALPSTSASASESSSPASRTNEAGIELNQRGNIPKALGQEAGLGHPTDPNAPWAFTFAVDSITVDPQCTSGYADPPANGHYIAINVRATTSPDLPSDWYIQVNPDYFKVVGPDGITKDSLGGNSWSCLSDAEAFTLDVLGPGQQYAGAVVIDSPVANGSLIYSLPGGETGWEWQF